MSCGDHVTTISPGVPTAGQRADTVDSDQWSPSLSYSLCGTVYLSNECLCRSSKTYGIVSVVCY